MGARARNPADKLARRESILAIAEGVLSRRQYGSLTMAEVADACGLAKGTLYLYFASKEELFLATLEREFARWFDDLGRELLRRAPVSAREFADAVARSLATRGTLADLLPLLHTVLEHNLAADTALRFKRMLRDKVVTGGALVEQVLPGLREGDGVRLLLRTHALVVGLRQLSDPPPDIQAVLALDELSALRVEFERELADALAAMAAGMSTHLRSVGTSERT